jgi:hypothetical protein
MEEIGSLIKATVRASQHLLPLLPKTRELWRLFKFRVNPPDPVGDVGPNHYVEKVNLVFAVYDKLGNRLLGPVDNGTLWTGFAVPDCTDPSGDVIVLYDKLEDCWLLSQFTTRGPI